jgi:hypothetical protein
LHGIHEFLDFIAEVVDLLFKTSHFLYFFEVIDLDDFFLVAVQEIHLRAYLFTFFFGGFCLLLLLNL